MTTMEMESQRLMLAREILNTDNREFLKEMSKAYHRIKARMIKNNTMEPDSKEYIRDSIEQGLKDVKEGRTRPLEELLNEL